MEEKRKPAACLNPLSVFSHELVLYFDRKRNV